MYEWQITSQAGKYKSRKRIGRGTGSGHGKTCGRGNKGSRSRSGAMRESLHEGGQIPVFRRMPKRGFSNVRFARCYEIVNVSQLERFDEGSVIGLETLCEVGLIDSASSMVKILGAGALTKRLQVAAHRFSKSAEQKITGCGGTVQIL
ncbi:MAG: 50S ribosomal protein L15 [Sedimentisphaerales bacterium]|nr:50S ribosomal protein L15 [Sedimentisphaerales bacterium]